MRDLLYCDELLSWKDQRIRAIGDLHQTTQKTTTYFVRVVHVDLNSRVRPEPKGFKHYHVDLTSEIPSPSLLDESP